VKVWVVSLEWNQPPSEMVGDTGIEGVYAEEGPAQTFAHATRLKLEEDGHDVYEFSMLAGRHCIGCGDVNMKDGKPHVCKAEPDNEDYCDHCGAELTDNGTCDNNHDEWDVDVHCAEHEVQA
jgi:hypothetical protein